jgi:hypothetical protein
MPNVEKIVALQHALKTTEFVPNFSVLTLARVIVSPIDLLQKAHDAEIARCA